MSQTQGNSATAFPSPFPSHQMFPNSTTSGTNPSGTQNNAAVTANPFNMAAFMMGFNQASNAGGTPNPALFSNAAAAAAMMSMNTNLGTNTNTATGPNNAGILGGTSSNAPNNARGMMMGNSPAALIGAGGANNPMMGMGHFNSNHSSSNSMGDTTTNSDSHMTPGLLGIRPPGHLMMGNNNSTSNNSHHSDGGGGYNSRGRGGHHQFESRGRQNSDDNEMMMGRGGPPRKSFEERPPMRGGRGGFRGGYSGGGRNMEAVPVGRRGGSGSRSRSKERIRDRDSR